MPARVLLRPTAAVMVAALAAAGCSSPTTSAESTATTTVSEAPTAATSTPEAAPASVAPRISATGPTDGDRGTTGGRANGGTGSDEGRSGGPTIVYFRVAEKPSCPAGTTVNPVAGHPVLVEWKATNVDSVALSVDGPGVYRDTYPAAGSESFTFPCSGVEGDVQRHTYLLTVRNADGTRTKTLAVSARVHDIPAV
ncbi:hypothetical protein [Micromonospora robiginosa]|uniref:Ig-like domain-containing protein n=1 Tax=Micromonospora robiginosa TaxID=2749844 RepID=A0A7L6B470_9ACTN|nr:hypothetical protein [Micromonospora ferruginea]QLQ36692.1 hypothetical protein H1D33_26080 [Micromonospora ferruginea]